LFLKLYLLIRYRQYFESVQNSYFGSWFSIVSVYYGDVPQLHIAFLRD
jgi:hypothetical protein